MKSTVIVFPGSNCDRDISVALKKMQFKNQMVWHKETKLPKSDLIVVPGGFSYGDYLRSGAIAGKSAIINEVGEYKAKLPFDDKGTLSGRAYTIDKRTFYSKNGDYIARISILISILLLLISFSKLKK